MSPDKKCKWCTYWNIFQYVSFVSEETLENETPRRHNSSYERHECRKRSPKYQKDIAGRNARWPETDGLGWCGDFQHFKT